MSSSITIKALLAICGFGIASVLGLSSRPVNAHEDCYKQSLGLPGSWTWVCKPHIHAPSLEESSSTLPAMPSYRQGRAIHLTNHCTENVELILQYQDTSGNWVTKGWWNFNPEEANYLASSGTTIRTKNNVFYYYARIPGEDYTWSGNNNRTFEGQAYPMKQDKLVVADGISAFSVACSNLAEVRQQRQAKERAERERQAREARQQAQRAEQERREREAERKRREQEAREKEELERNVNLGIRAVDALIDLFD